MAISQDGEVNCVTLLNPALDVDLDEIDDKEFDIPRVDKPPTLESILNAPDDDLSIADNCIVDSVLQVSGWHAHLRHICASSPCSNGAAVPYLVSV